MQAGTHTRNFAVLIRIELKHLIFVLNEHCSIEWSLNGILSITNSVYTTEHSFYVDFSKDKEKKEKKILDELFDRSNGSQDTKYGEAL